MSDETFGDFDSDAMYESFSDSHNNSMDAMSNMVQSMATQIYAEFERLIGNYGDGVVEGLMPQLVGILENWDKTLKEKQKVQLELDLTKEDNDQLLEQYEREKQLRKSADQRNMEIEDVIEEQRKELQTKLEYSDKNCRMLEIKVKSHQDQITRLEENETLSKGDYDKLHERYTELFKSHMEMMERTKAMMSSEKADGESSPSITERSLSKNSLKPTGSNLVCPPTPEEDISQSFSDKATPTIPSLPSPSTESSQIDLSLKSEITSERTGHNLALSLEAAAFDELDPEMDNLAGMTKEVENLIKENQELIQTKNALNVVKDDLIGQVDDLTGSLELLRSELQSMKNQKKEVDEKVSGLEEEIKQLNLKQQASENTENEEDIPRAQRKRFTRVEMARVLMERNQYKERLMELQEAVRWTEMIRASKENPENTQKKKTGLWSLFSNLFAGNSKSKKLPSASVHFNAPSTHLQPVGDPNKPRRLQELSGGDKSKAYDFLQEDAVMKAKNDLMGINDRLTEQGRRQKEADRRDKYRQVQAYVTKDDGRVQAYGWSVPTQAAEKQTLMSVPVPVYCRPLISAEDESTTEKEGKFKLWCAAAVYRSAGRTRDGGSIVGAHSMFYSDADNEPIGSGDADAVLSKSPQLAELNQQLQNHQRALSDSADVSKLTSLVWLCTTTGQNSKVQVINASNPAEVLESFQVPDAHILTIASIPGISEQDYPSESDSHDNISTKSSAADGAESVTVKYVNSPSSTTLSKASDKCDSVSEESSATAETGDNASIHSIDESKRKLILPTMWLGLQNGLLAIHSSLDDWKQPIRSVDLGDCILSIVHISGKVFVGLANGTMAVFHRNADGAWCFDDYHIIDFGEDKVPLRTLTHVANSHLWIGHRNRVYVVNVHTLMVTTTFEAHPSKDSQVRLLTWSGDGVWVAIRNDVTLRLYHAFTMEHLQDINIQPCVEKLIGEDKQNLCRVTSLELACSRLWVGTGNGIIISIPLTLENQQDASKAVDIPGKDKPPGGAVRVYSDVQGDQVTPASYVPYCDISQAQLSYHGHRDCVRFFSTIAGNSKETSLVMSGGEGYIDFRVGDDEGEPGEDSPVFWSHLIVWEVSNSHSS